MAEVIQKLQFKRGTKANLEAILVGDKKPAAGEPILEFEKNSAGGYSDIKLKIGDGVSDYKDLPYFSSSGVVEQVEFKSRQDFPTSGQINKLYIATDEKNAYIWDPDISDYVLTAADSQLNNIQTISGGDASGI